MRDLSNFVWRKPSFLLINFGMEALGVRQLASFLKKLECKVNVLFLEHAMDSNHSYIYADLVAKFVLDKKIDIVGISCMTGHYYAARSITRLIKSQSKGPLVIWGGVHPTTCAEECIIGGGADLVFNASAEKSLEELLSGTDPRDVTNIAFKSNEELINNYSDIYIYPPDIMPFPDFEFNDHFIINDNQIKKLDDNLFRERYPWKGTHYYAITARGCPYHCAYCCNIYHGHFKRKSVDYFIQELHYIEKKVPFFQTLSIQDDSIFMQNISWIEEFSEKYKREINKPLRAALMPRFAVPEKLEPLAAAGLTYVGIGLQGSSRLNREIYGRKETSESFLRAVDNYSRFGIAGRVDVIVDNPYEREDDLMEIARTLNEVPKPFPISVFTLTLFPGTKMARKAQEDGIASLFAGDAYIPDLGLNKNSANTYKTPEHWKRLFNNYLPNLPKNICNYLINNINNQNLRHKIVKYSPWANIVRAIGTKLRDLSPRRFDISLKYFKRIVWLLRHACDGSHN